MSMLKTAWAELKHRPTRLVAVLVAIAIGTAFASAAAVFGSTAGAAIERAVAQPLAPADVVVSMETDDPAAVDKAGQALRDDPSVSASAMIGLGFFDIVDDSAATMRVESDPGAASLRTTELSAGAWPKDAAQVTLDPGTAKARGLHVGDQFAIKPYGEGAAPITLKVVGITKADSGLLAADRGTSYVTAAFFLDNHELTTTKYIAQLADGASADAAVTHLKTQLGSDATVVTGDTARQDAVQQASGGTTVISTILGVFAAIALAVAAIVIANTFTILLTQRRQQIALQRLVGATSAQVRRQVLIEATAIGVVGSVLGTGLGVGIAVIGAHLTGLTDAGIRLSPLGLGFALVVGVVVTVLAALAPSARIMGIAPIAALRPVEASVGGKQLSTTRKVVSFVLTILGLVPLLLGAWTGQLVIATGGGIVTVIGILLGAQLIVAPMTRLLGGPFRASGTPGKMAVANVLRHPARATSTATALIVGVGLIVTLQVAAASARATVLQQVDMSGDERKSLSSVLDVMTTVASSMLAVAAVIAVVGIANTLALSVIERTRESGLMRALGLQRSQMRGMLMAEGLLLALVGTTIGVVLGIGFGLAGAASAVQELGLVVAIPWLQMGVVVVLALAGGVLASVMPARKAARVAPVTALATA
ncbi:MacB-like protein [Antricoccus suffuscus]|uniref:MacB-like protein n=1 Tax=Antricoccus suffuscus TaxID=1629062 RepID=A0A2T0ZYY0_9ACTN|nr:FtsX-like permease family protein [Antricoccus suffuscus]PRZ41494.1 MacB-like protein [Antricoccus suffuscus]